MSAYCIGLTGNAAQWAVRKQKVTAVFLELQAAVLETYRNERDRKTSKRGKLKKSTKRYDDESSDDDSGDEKNFITPSVARHQSMMSAGQAQRLGTRRAESRPVAQIAPNSSLGVALGGLAHHPSDPSDTSSEDEGRLLHL